ncbi:MAG TPA: glycosyltransferase 87 family protein [Thermoanaerobaculia bacterium]|nr:glycosyltransferase 87 family protein [Thermoanaerobaculia bacterium]
MALILLVAAVALAPLTTARFGFRGFVALYAVATLLWLTLRRITTPLALSMLLGLALRLFFLIPEPALSGDVYRYLSDGRQLASGHNPYAYTPSDPRINHPEIRSIYPPHAQLLFALFHTMTAWKLALIAADLAAIALLHRYGAAFAFATCPLVLFEGAWNGHIDALAAVFLAFALTRRSGWLAGIAAGLKIIPIAAVPPLFGRRPPLSFFLALFVPFLFFVRGPIMPGFHDYATRWIFNSPLYSLTRAIVERVPTKEIWTNHPLRFAAISDVVYRHVYPDFITRVILAIIAMGAILLARRVTSAVAALLLCSPAIHPWYWLTLVPCAFIEKRSAMLFLALCAPFSYLLYTSAPPLLVHALCYGIPLVTLARD